MALSAKVGSFAANTSTGDQSVAGLGFQPVLVFLWAQYRVTGDGNTADRATEMFGAFTASEQIACTSDITSTAVGNQSVDLAKCLQFFGEGYYTFVSMDVGGFTLNLGQAFGTPSAIIVNYLALGGTDLTNVDILEFQSPATAQSQAYTGVGFQPDAVLVVSPFIYQQGAAPASSSSAYGCVRSLWASGDSVALSGQVYGSDAKGVQKADKAISATSESAIRNEATLTSLDADGFTLNWTTVTDSNNTRFYAISLKGLQVAVGAFNQATSTGDQSVTGLGFQPKALLLLTTGYATSASLQTSARLAIGAATSSTARFTQWHGKVGPVNGGDTDMSLDRTKVLKTFSEGTPTLLTSADFVSFDSGGFTINNGTVDATSREILYLALGDAAAGGIVIPVLVAQRRFYQ